MRRWFWRRELHAITWRSVLMYPEERSITSASPSDICCWLWCLCRWLHIRYNSFWVNLTGNLWSLFYCSINMFKWKWKQAMFDIIFSFIVLYVRSLNYISAAINMYKWKWKRGYVWHIWSVNTVRKIVAAEASWLMLSSMLLFAELLDIVPSTGVKSELPRMQVWNLHTWYW